MIEACVEAFNITRDKSWLGQCGHVFLIGFLGHNDLNLPLYDAKTGGCRDGLMADGINQNEGAESSLAWLLSADHHAKHSMRMKSLNRPPLSNMNWSSINHAYIQVYHIIVQGL